MIYPVNVLDIVVSNFTFPVKYYVNIDGYVFGKLESIDDNWTIKAKNWKEFSTLIKKEVEEYVNWCQA